MSKRHIVYLRNRDDPNDYVAVISQSTTFKHITMKQEKTYFLKPVHLDNGLMGICTTDEGYLLKEHPMKERYRPINKQDAIHLKLKYDIDIRDYGKEFD